MRYFLLLIVLLWGTAWSQESPPQLYDMRGDQGIMEQFGPRGVCWTQDGKLLVVERRFPAFHLFDLEGRRFKFLGNPQETPEVFYNALCPLKPNQFLACGSHYHFKNNLRFVSSRSFIHLMQLDGEKFTPESGKVNLSPDRALRTTHMYGESPKEPMEISGIAADPKHNRIFLGLARPLQEDGSVIVLEGKLDLFLSQSIDLKLEPIKTGLVPEIEPALGVPFFLNDLQYVEDKGLVLLLSTQTNDEKQFGSNQIWFMKGGFGPAKLVRKEIAPGNRAAGIAIRPVGSKGEYQAAIVCDNNMEDTKVPNRLLMLSGLRLPLR